MGVGYEGRGEEEEEEEVFGKGGGVTVGSVG